MRHLQIIVIYLFLSGLLLAVTDEKGTAPPLGELSLKQLETRLAEIDTELEELARVTLRAGTGAVGYRSKTHGDPSHTESIRIQLNQTTMIDQVVLVPTLYRNPDGGIRAESFPLEFQIHAGTAHESQIVASRSREDQLLPRIAPLAVSFPPVNASWIEIEATTLTTQIFTDHYLLQLSEVMVFSGMENVALTLNTRSSKSGSGHDRQRYLTDGFTPYLMNAAQGAKSQTQLLRVQNTTVAPSLTLDLKSKQTINQINLHTHDVSLSIPMRQFSNSGVPRHIRITGANHADFRDEKHILDHEQLSIYDTGPINMLKFPELTCRFIRITILDHREVVSLSGNTSGIGFSEIEVLSNGRNVALNAPITLSSNLKMAPELLPRLTDGLNYYGMILPTRDWMNQLSRRHDLEAERPLVAAELNLRHHHQQTHLQRLTWFAALLIVGIIITLLLLRVFHLRELSIIKERIAADLHDELGANFHSIGLLSQLVEKKAAPLSEDTSKLLQRIRDVTQSSGVSVRHISRLQDAKNSISMETEMRRAAERIVVDLQHEMNFEGQAWLEKLRPQERVDLFLFYKECLINICRHAGATKLYTDLKADAKKVTLSVIDNGAGVGVTDDTQIPAALARRAKLLGADFELDSPKSGGTRILLCYQPRSKWWRKLPALKNRN
ncbi:MULTISPECIES: sensor histidine kinase [unclassified Lentimonas]|uniref:sensor histidine kinase n=1 Tax=unclassified Lentimonas TaxID=2630993 RepID=UPI001324F783|nr:MULTISPECIES: histidine kinase [unclassified Lentimonas]CAA6677755.1 Unannotated [Lentimonas sp. CC4]CAA6685019.1 Unannotated [Lentimonas sp. CC6]CAA6691691.1 Unannotated [Lentimonas sp. CC19]CAA6696021.1 Unannotated [Lentimonas sp. CC10]CAA7070045.1 Unannotated [Lentimonas sp. CC11]